jgi:pimeloyl-ACP methyl ester carboxylesterase
MDDQKYLFILDEKIYVETFGNKDNPVIILIHGGLSYPGILKNIIDLLKDNYYIIAPHFLGHGLSSGNRGDVNIDSNIKVILGVINYFKLTKVTLIGHSFGGLAAYVVNDILSKDNVVTVEKLILISPAIYLGKSTNKLIRFDFSILPNFILKPIETLANLLPKWIVINSNLDWTSISNNKNTMINNLNDGLISKTTCFYSSFSPIKYMKQCRDFKFSVPTKIILGNDDKIIDYEKVFDLFSLLPKTIIDVSDWKKLFSTMENNISELIIINGGSHEFYND